MLKILLGKANALRTSFLDRFSLNPFARISFFFPRFCLLADLVVVVVAVNLLCSSVSFLYRHDCPHRYLPTSCIISGSSSKDVFCCCLRAIQSQYTTDVKNETERLKEGEIKTEQESKRKWFSFASKGIEIMRTLWWWWWWWW